MTCEVTAGDEGSRPVLRPAWVWAPSPSLKRSSSLTTLCNPVKWKSAKKVDLLLFPTMNTIDRVNIMMQCHWYSGSMLFKKNTHRHTHAHKKRERHTGMQECRHSHTHITYSIKKFQSSSLTFIISESLSVFIHSNMNRRNLHLDSIMHFCRPLYLLLQPAVSPRDPRTSVIHSHQYIGMDFPESKF